MPCSFLISLFFVELTFIRQIADYLEFDVFDTDKLATFQ